MSRSNFAFLKENPDFAMFAEACMEAERSLAVSPVICALGARRAFEQAIEWVYLAEHEALPDPYDRMRAARRSHSDEPLQFRKLSALYHEREFRALLNDDHLWQSLQYIIKAGNIAAHRNSHLQRADAVFSLSVLFDFISWIDYCYGKPSGTVQGGFHGRLRAFDASALPAPGAIVDPKALKAREDAARATYEKQLDAKDSRILELEKLVGEMSEQLAARRAERPTLGPIDADKLNEYETRRRYIDLDLQMVGWDMRHDVAIEYPVTGMEGKPGANGRIDYLLKGRDGRPLAIIEAKRTSYDPSKGLQQARLYADCIERDTGRRPLIFLSNGYETFFADDGNGTYRRVGEIFSQDDMQRIMNRLDGSTPVIDPSLVKVNTDVAGGGGRAYQLEAIQRVCDVINKGDRTALLAMATGTGKTRVSAAIVDVLRRAGRVTNVLFLADRTELVAQAASAYGEYFPDWSLCNLCANKRDADAEVVFSTYQTMVNMIDSAADPTGGDKPTFTSGHFDMIIVDEAHRSIFKKFKVIFDHFDAFTMGLTATPRDEVDRNTYDFFKLQEHVPTFVYEYETALADGVLVPYRNIEVETAFMTEGITYDDLSDEDKERFEEDFGGGGDSAVIADDGFDDPEGDPDGGGSARALPKDMPDHISAADINKRVMNANTVDRVIDDLLAHGIRTDGGQRLGKTIIFAQNQAHARYIVRRFGEREPKMAANGFIKVVVSSDDRSGSIIKEFKLQPNSVIAVSVDMMDTGVDVPEVVNLVFFKRVRSKIKFLQMLGRGTRLCPGLDCVEGVAPGDDADADTEDAGMAGEYVGKRRFMVFDYCGNFEFFRQHKDTVEPAMPKSLSERIFARKVELARALQSPACTADEGLLRWRGELIDDLHGQVAALDGTKASVRTKREYVERYRDRKAFDHLGDLNVRELVKEVAPLAHYDDEDQYALRFDALMYSLMAVAAGALGPSVGVTGTGADAGAGPGAGTGADADTTASDMRARPTAPDGTPTTATSFASVAGMAGMASAKSRSAHIAKVRQSVRRLMDRMTIPAVASQRALIERIANDDGYLRDAPLPELERIRLALRGLIRYSVDDANRHIIITDLTDPVTQRAEGLPFDMREDYEDYRLKVNRYINEHLGDGAIAKLRHNQPLTADDWSELEQVFTERLGTNAEYEEAFRDESFGMTVRRIAKLDHAAAQDAFAGFIAAHTLNGDQIAFMNRVIAYVEQNGTIDMADLIKPPFDRPMPLVRLFGGNTAVLSDLADSIRRMNANAMAPAA